MFPRVFQTFEVGARNRYQGADDGVIFTVLNLGVRLSLNEICTFVNFFYIKGQYDFAQLIICIHEFSIVSHVVV